MYFFFYEIFINCLKKVFLLIKKKLPSQVLHNSGRTQLSCTGAILHTQVFFTILPEKKTHIIIIIVQNHQTL